jgi:RNA polymerase sigma-70 factor (ECF subfamily)
MLGSDAEAEDAVQEAWLRLSRSDAAAVENLRGWLTTVVARVCLDMLRSRKIRREEDLDERMPEPADSEDSVAGFEREAILADSMGLALMVVLETLAPSERVAFVLHDLFDLPFDDIAKIVGKSPAAARQLASRARRRVQGASADREADRARKLEVVQAFLAASRDGNFEALLAVLDPNVVAHADAVAVAAGGQAELRGAHDVAASFKGRARAVLPMLVDGEIAGAWAPAGTPRVVLRFTIDGGRITSIEVVMDPARLAALQVEPLDA